MKIINSTDAKTILDNIKGHSLIKISQHNIESNDDLIEFAKTLGPLLAWEFGLINELKVNADINNYLYSNEKVPFHWDGAFYQEPHLLIFHCIKAPEVNSGGETLFTSGNKVLNNLDRKHYKQLKKLKIRYQTDKKAHYGGNIIKDCINKHPKDGRPILRFAEPVKTKLNPVKLTLLNSPQRQAKRLQKMITQELYHPSNCYKHCWQDNDLIIADNHTLLHGRNAFKKNSHRFIKRIQVL